MNELQFSIVYGSPATTVVLTHSPDGWDDNFIEIQRSKDFHGFMTTFIPTLKFVKDGATLLRTLFYTPLPYSQKVYLTVDKLDKIDLTYSQIFYGEIKMDTFVDFDNYVQVTVAEGGLSILLKQGMEKTFDLEMLMLSYYANDFLMVRGDPTSSTLCVESKGIFYYLFNFITYSPYIVVNMVGFTSPTAANSYYHVVGQYNNQYVYADHDNTYIIFFSQTLQANQWVLHAGTTINESAANYAYTTDAAYPYESLIRQKTWDVAGTFTGTIDNYLVDPATAMSSSYNPYALDIGFFDVYNESLMFTQGYFMRTRSSAWDDDGWIPFNCSLKDMFNACDTILSIGMGIQLVAGVETLIVREKSYFYQSIEIENIGEVGDDFKLSVWENAISSVRIGFPKQDHTLNNTNEINSESTYSLINSIFNKELNMVCPFRGDSTGFDEIISGVAYDSDIFIVNTYNHSGQLELAPGHIRRIINHAIITKTAKNVAFSPQRCLITNQNYINSLIYGITDDYWRLSITNDERKSKKEDYSDPPGGESSTDTGITWVQERTGMSISDGTKFLLPFIFEFQGKVSEDFTTNYKANQNGYITFTYNGETYKGFIYYAKYKPSGKTNCTFKLISTPDNDLTKLIR